MWVKGSAKNSRDREKFVLPVGAMTSAPASVTYLPAMTVSGPVAYWTKRLHDIEGVGIAALRGVQDLHVLAGGDVHQGAESFFRLIGKRQRGLVELETCRACCRTGDRCCSRSNGSKTPRHIRFR